MPKSQFRKDINGLRAIAVLLVLVFHFNEAWLSGGFVGVDVFFVISGYLMTGIIVRKVDMSSFSLISFYADRANRIIPPLLFLCIAVLVAGWFYATPIAYEAVAKHVFVSLTFLSNIIYANEANYFAINVYENWLLHTWSLSAEWQFYIVYPLLIFLLSKLFSRHFLGRALLIFLVMTFLYSLFLTYKSPNDAYYSLTARAWQMLAGGVVWIYPYKFRLVNKRVLEVLGLFLILISSFFISGENYWPGYLALLPVLGAVLIILSDRQDSLLTSNFVLQKIGSASYSIYLWHWPLVVLLYSVGFSYGLMFFLIVLSILIGFLSYFFLEKLRFFNLLNSSFKEKFSFKMIALFLVVLLSSLIIKYFDGINNSVRYGAASLKAQYLNKYSVKNKELMSLIQKEYLAECNFFDLKENVSKKMIAENCITGGVGGVFLWGDSHAQALSYGIRKNLSADVPFSQVASSSCAPRISESKQLKGQVKEACDKSNAFAKKKILSVRPKVIVLAQRDSHDLNNFESIVEFLLNNKLETKLVLVGPMPQWRPSLPEAIAKRHFDSNKRKIEDETFLLNLQQLDAFLMEKYKGSEITYLSLIESLCDGRECLVKVDGVNTPIVWDYGHLTLGGSNFVADTILVPQLKKILEIQ